ncbi:MAG: adenylate/guanylate cyclase domain-containing protein [Ignavibacteria bacterium]
MSENETKIPSGNVTFFFTDIEGSTKLAQEFPDTLPSALEKHNSILKNVVEINNGFVFKIVGDAYCCAFQNAADAVKAAVEIQINIENENWDGAVIRIRIGIHSGNAEWNGDDYMGYITLARVARVMSAAYGGQILISNDTYKLFSHHKDTNPPQAEQRENESDSLCLSDLVVKNVCFRDLGERRLKDVIEPIRLYQVESEGLRKEFPPLKTLDARPNNLPIQLTSFIGREKEMKFVKEELKNSRLLTLTGTGGAGKSRLSLQAAADLIDDFANGVWFTELAADAISDLILYQ